MKQYKQEDLLRDIAVLLTLNDDIGDIERIVRYKAKSRVNNYAWRHIREEVAQHKYDLLKDQIANFEADYGPYLKKGLDTPKI